MLNLLFGSSRRTAEPASDERLWSSTEWLGGRRRTQAGPTVDEELALTYAAVWCATRILAETCSILPLFLYERTADDGRKLATSNPLFDLLHSSPNPTMGSMAFREGRVAHQVNWGNGFAEIERESADPESDVVALWPIHPSRVRPSCRYDTYENGNSVGDGQYIVWNEDGSRTALAPAEVLHIPGVLPDDGIWGKGVIAYARESIGFGLATERHGATYFGGGATPPGIVYGAGMKDQEARKHFRKEWKEIHGHPDSGEIAILPLDARYEKISIPNEDSQFLETRVHNVREISRWYKVPAHMLGDLEKAGYSSIEHLSIEFVIYSIMPWLRRSEEQMSLKLLTPNQRKRFFIEHQLASLLRGDIRSRYEAYSLAIQNGWMNRNEVRRLENLNSIGPDGDRYFVPLNMTPLDRVDDAIDKEEKQPIAKAPTPSAGAGPGPDEEMGMRALAKEMRSLISNGRPVIAPVLAPAAALMAPVASHAACKAVLEDALRRMLVKEANAVRRFFRDAAFEARLAEFHRSHAGTVEEALAPSVSLLGSLGGSATATALATELISSSRTELVMLYDRETPAGFALMLDGWQSRSAGMAARWIETLPVRHVQEPDERLVRRVESIEKVVLAQRLRKSVKEVVRDGEGFIVRIVEKEE